jgi:hypothetical protein
MAEWCWFDPNEAVNMIPRNPAKAKHPVPLGHIKNRFQIATTVCDLIRQRLIAGWSAMGGGSNQYSSEFKGVATARARGLVSQSRAPQSGEQKISAAVSGKHPSGSVGPMGGRGETYNQEIPICIPEVRNRFPPILFVGERCSALVRHLLSPGDKARTETALNQLGVELIKFQEGLFRSALVQGVESDYADL